MISILKAFSDKSGLVKIQELLASKKHSKTDIKKYLKKVNCILNTFKYQFVYDTVKGKLVHMTHIGNIKAHTLWNNDVAVDYIGFAFDNVKKFVEGKLDVKTLKERSASEIDFDKIVRFLKYKPDAAEGRLNNLCALPVSYSNFDLKARSLDEMSQSNCGSEDSLVLKTPESALKRVKHQTNWNNIKGRGCKNGRSEPPTADKSSNESYLSIRKTRYK